MSVHRCGRESDDPSDLAALATASAGDVLSGIRHYAMVIALGPEKVGVCSTGLRECTREELELMIEAVDSELASFRAALESMEAE